MTDKPAVEAPEYTAIMAVFRRTKADGTYYYSDADVRHWLPMALLTQVSDMANWSPSMLSVFGDAMKAAGVQPGTKDPLQALQRYYAKNPVNAELAAELGQVLSAMVTQLREGDLLKLRELQKRNNSANVDTGSALQGARGGGVGLGAKRRK